MFINQPDPGLSLMLDGNAAAGILNEIFAVEMTANPVECNNCNRVGELGTLMAFIHSAGVVLRCPTCENVILRIVQTPKGIYLDLRGAAYLQVMRGSAT